MNTQILSRPVYTNDQQMATLSCPQCGRTKATDVAKFKDAPRPPKVKCPCGHRFRVPIATPLAVRYRCVQCAGQGYRIVAQEKKISVSTEGYHYHTLERREPCPACHGLGVCYPAAPRGGKATVLRTPLAALADTTVRCLTWCTQQVGADGASLRTWLERDISLWGHRRKHTTA
jgi:hypothetical protein